MPLGLRRLLQPGLAEELHGGWAPLSLAPWATLLELSGLAVAAGIALDREDNLYVLAAATRMLGEKPYWDKMTGTLVKLKPKGRILSTAAPLAMADPPGLLMRTTTASIRSSFNCRARPTVRASWVTSSVCVKRLRRWSSYAGKIPACAFWRRRRNARL